jgi:hypothetical protein
MTITVGTCTTTVNASAVTAALRTAANVTPALGQPASRLVLNGSLNVAPSCGLPTTMSVIANGSVVAGVTTGVYSLSGTLTEN